MTRVLVADDDSALRKVVRDALLQEGYQVDAVCNGRQALSAIAAHRPALVLLDLDMPGIDGPALVHILHDQTPWASLPFVVVSASAAGPEIGRGLGARACIRKPFDLGELIATVEQAAPPDY
jgi:CheY-like chemotaxis protein